MKKNILTVIINQVLVALAMMLVAYIKEDSATNVFLQRFPGYIYLWGLFLLISLLFDKYNFARRRNLKGHILPVIQANFVFAAIVSLFLVLTNQMAISRTLFFGTLGIVAAVEFFAALITGMFRETQKKGYTYEHQNNIHTKQPVPEQPATVSDDAPAFVSIHDQLIRKSVLDEVGQGAVDYLDKNVPWRENSIVFAVNNPLNILTLPPTGLNAIINLEMVNNHRYVNKFFEAVNLKLPVGGIFAGVGDTKEIRKKRFYRRFTPVLGFILYTFGFFFHRACPKLPILRKVYFHLTKGKNRVMSRAEILGRLCSCGFKVINESYVDNKLFFVVKKEKRPEFDRQPTYGPLIRLRRVGKNHKLIGVYKLRTMHPYSEYLQEYVYWLNGTRDGDKITDDFRITTWGRILRKFWIDELPMLVNWVKGDLKLVGVRPLSLHKFNTYPEDLQKLRVKFKPGLVPPFYADLPKTEEAFYKSEETYINNYEKAPFKTDLKYFIRAFINIVFKNARSK